MSSYKNLQIRVFDYGHLGVLDAEDKISLTFRDEFGQLVRTTKVMSLEEFKENSAQEFQQAFPGYRPRLFTSRSPNSRLFSQPYLPDEFSATLALLATNGEGYAGTLERTQTTTPEYGLDEPNSFWGGIQVYVGWDTAAMPIHKAPTYLDWCFFGDKCEDNGLVIGFDLEFRDFFGVEKIVVEENSGKLPEGEEGNRSIIIVTRIENNPNTKRPLWVYDTYVYDQDGNPLPNQRKRGMCNLLDDNQVGVDGLFSCNTHSYDENFGTIGDHLNYELLDYSKPRPQDLIKPSTSK